MLSHGGVPVGAVAETAVVGREVEAIDFCIALLVGIVNGGVHGLLGREELLTVHHAPTEENDLCFRVVTAHLFVELLETIEKQDGVGTLSGGVVGAKVDADDFDRSAAGI